MLSDSATFSRTPPTPRPKAPEPREVGGFLRATEPCSCFLVPDSGRALAARVVDVSSDGIRLALKRRVEPGAILGIEWQGGPCRTPCFLLTIVQRSVAQAGGWIVSGRFACKLNPEDGRALS